MRNPSWGPRNKQRPHFLQLFTNGISFPATQVPSSDANTLDDYEESTWTPAFSFVTPGDFAAAYDIQTGSAIKIGRRVFLDYSLRTTSFTYTTAAGDLLITGLPYAAQTASFYAASGTPWWGGLTLSAGFTQLVAAIISSESQIRFVMVGSTKTAADAGTANAPTGAAAVYLMRGTLSYLAAA